MPALQIDIAAKFAQVLDGLDQINKKTASTAKSMESAFNGVKTVLGAIGVGLSVNAFKDMIEGSLEAVAGLHKLSLQTGITVETLSALKGVAKQSGTDFDEVAKLVNKLEGNMSTFAQSGAGKAAAAFQQLGFSQKDIKTGLQNIDTFLPEFAKRLVETGVGGEQAGLAMQLLQKGGAAALPFLKALADNGPLVAKTTTAQAESAHEFEVQMVKLKSSSEQLKKELALELLPTLKNVLDTLLKFKTAGGIFDNLFLSADQVKNAGSAIVELEGKLASLKETRDKLTPKDGDSIFSKAAKAFSADDLAIVNTQIAVLESEKKALVKIQNSVLEQATKDTGPEKPKKDLIHVDTEKDLAARRAAAEAALRLSETQAKILLDEAKAAADGQLAILDKLHSQGLIGEQAFWDQRTSIQKKALDVEINALDDQIAKLDAAIQKPPKGSSEADAINRERELETALAHRAALQDQAAQRERLDNLDREKAGADYLKQLEQINVEILQLQGNTEAAARAALNIQVRDLSKQLGGDAAGAELTARFKKAGEAQIEYNVAAAETQRILDELSIAQSHIDLAAQSGALSELGVLREKSAANAEVLESLRKQYDILQRLAELNPENKNLQVQADQLKLTIDQLDAQTHQVSQRLKGVLSDAFADDFAKILDGTESISQGFKNMANSILSQVNRLVAQDIGKQIFNSMKGGGDSGGGGGLLDLIFGKGTAGGPGAGGGLSDLLGLFTGGYSSFNIGSFGNFGPFLASAKGNIMTPMGAIPLHRYAMGGVTNGPIAIAGEAGREAIIPLPDGRAVPVKMKGEGGGGNTNVYFTVHAQDADSFRKSRGQILGDLNRAVRDAGRRYRF